MTLLLPLHPGGQRRPHGRGEGKRAPGPPHKRAPRARRGWRDLAEAEAGGIFPLQGPGEPRLDPRSNRSINPQSGSRWTSTERCQLTEADLADLLEKYEISEALFGELIEHAYFRYRDLEAHGSIKEAERALAGLLKAQVESGGVLS